MDLRYNKSFEKCLKKITHQKTKDKILDFILSAKRAEVLTDLHNVKKLSGYETFYRYRFGDYRIGFEKIDDHTIELIVVAKRNDIYKIFP